MLLRENKWILNGRCPSQVQIPDHGRDGFRGCHSRPGRSKTMRCADKKDVAASPKGHERALAEAQVKASDVIHFIKRGSLP
jgi:hypothetical protein